jgi:hypothetical protein
MSYKKLNDVLLRDIDLGSIDGDYESKNIHFKDYFYNRHTDYELIKNQKNKFLITGRKGSGKTYLSKYLAFSLKNDGYLTKTIKWNDINLNTLVELGNISDSSESGNFYRFIIFIEISRLILSFSLKDSLNWKKTPIKFIKAFHYKSKLKRFYEERYPSGNYSIDKINIKNSTTEKVDVNSLVKGIKSSCEANEIQDVEYRKKNINEVLEQLEKIVYCFIKYVPILLISDDLDEQNLNLLNDTSFKEFLIKYINVISEINLEIEKYNSKCIIVIRDDILEALNSKSSNINKIITGSNVHINWCEKVSQLPWENDITKMILNKIKISANIDPETDDKEVYLHFFDKKIERKNCIEYLVSRSLGRPRDIVEFLSEIKEKNGDYKKFYPKAFRSVLSDYSNYFIREFKNELSIFYDSDFIEQGFNLLSSLNKSKFSFEEIEAFYQSNKDDFPKIESVKEILTIFYNVGLLGNEDNGAVSFSYRYDGKDKANFNVNFLVHYGAQKKLLTRL